MQELPIEETIKLLGGGQRAIDGVNRVAKRWQETDGDDSAFKTFCEKNFVSTEEELSKLLTRFESAMGSIGGHLYEIRRHLRRWTDLRGDEMPAFDNTMAMFDPCPDLSDQFYKQKVAFIALLAFIAS